MVVIDKKPSVLMNVVVVILSLQIISRITDGSKFSEFKKMFGPSLVTGFGYIHG